MTRQSKPNVLLAWLMALVLLFCTSIPALADGDEEIALFVIQEGGQADSSEEQSDEPGSPNTTDGSPEQGGTGYNPIPTSQPGASVEPESEKDTSMETSRPKPTATPLPIYVVRFLDNDGVVLLTLSMEHGSLIEDPGLYPTTEGYAFGHWYDAKVGTDALVFGTPVCKDTTFRPHLEPLSPEEPVEEEPDDVTVEKEEPEEEETEEEQGEAEGEGPSDPEQGEMEPSVQGKRSVVIFSNAGAVLHLGDMIVLTAVLRGYEGATYEMVWQRSGGAGWEDAQTGGMSLSYVLDGENYCWNWRLVVTVLADAAQADI